MNGVRGFIAGTIVVASAQVLVSSPSMAGRIGAFGDFLAVCIDRVVNPDVPAIGSADFVAPPPITFGGGDQPAQPGTPKRHRPKHLRSTKARHPIGHSRRDHQLREAP